MTPAHPHSLPEIVISACWIIFVVYWLIAAIFTKRTVFQQTTGESLGYRVLAVAGWLLVVKARQFPHSLGLRFIPPSDAVAGLAASLGVLGLAICLWARITLGRNWSGVVTLKEGHELVQRGPYRWVRHPIYTGLLTLFAGTVLLNCRWGGLLGSVPMFFSFWLKWRHEETLMLKEFPQDYPGYMQRAKRIIPFIY